MVSSRNTFRPAGEFAVEVAYQRMTRLLALADGKKNQGWVSVEGIELLLEQGYEQFKIFTGRRVPKKLVRQPVFEVYERNMAHSRVEFECPMTINLAD